MDLTTVFVMAIIFTTVYKVFELFVRRRERQTIVDKMPPEKIGEEYRLPGHSSESSSLSRFAALKWGALALGLGLGLFVYVLLVLNNPQLINMWSINTTACGALALTGGGLGLLVAFLIENSMRKRSYFS